MSEVKESLTQEDINILAARFNLTDEDEYDLFANALSLCQNFKKERDSFRKQIVSLEKKLGMAREALEVIPPFKLFALAIFFDKLDADDPRDRGGDVQKDLRKMAKLSDVALREIGEVK